MAKARLQIADRLCCAFGQDVLDTLFARESLASSNTKHGTRRRGLQARPVFLFMLSLGYVREFVIRYNDEKAESDPSRA